MQAPSRDQAIDLARGIAIIAIVAGHVLRGLSAAGLVDGASTSYVFADTLLYGFHLSVFALLAGLFIRRGVDKQGRWKYLWSRDATFLYLYVLWSLIQGGVKLLSAGLVNTPVTPMEVLDLVHPEGHLWFLPWLIIATTLAVVVRPWTSQRRAAITLVAAGAISLLFWGYAGDVIGPEGLPLWIFFAVGVTVGDRRFRAQLSRIKPVLALSIAGLSAITYAAAVAFLPVTAPTLGFDTRTALSVALGVVTSWVGVVFVLSTSRFISSLKSTPASRVLALLGTRSLEIYLAHGVALSGTRIALVALGVTSLPVHIAAGIGLGLFAPVLLWWLMRRLGLPWLFQAPSRLLPRK